MLTRPAIAKHCMNIDRMFLLRTMPAENSDRPGMVMNSTRAVAVIIQAVSPESSSSANARAGTARSTPAAPSRRTTEIRPASASVNRRHVFGAVGIAMAGSCRPTDVVSIVALSYAIEFTPLWFRRYAVVRLCDGPSDCLIGTLELVARGQASMRATDRYAGSGCPLRERTACDPYRKLRPPTANARPR